VNQPRCTSPVFIIGRQHSGNTLLTTILGRSPSVFSLHGEGTFFEHLPQLRQRVPEERADRVAELIGKGASSPHEVSGRLKEVLSSPNESAPVSALTLYRQGMEHLAAQCGKTRWAQKATSYVFYVDAILDAFPGARLIFLARNPLDIAASLKRRGRRHAIPRAMWGWNSGMKRVKQHREAHPENVLRVRYEDLARDTEATLQRICAFIEIPFDPSITRVSHVNRSETPYNSSSAVRGINASRVFYYRDVLSEAEEWCVRRLVSRSLLKERYPDLPPTSDRFSTQSLATTARILLNGLASTSGEHWQRLRSNPRHTVARLWERLW
jgi:hypothetical protein